MLLTATMKYRPSHQERLILDEMSYHAAKLWNVGNYQKHNYKALGFAKIPDWYQQKKALKDNIHYKMLPSQTSQELLAVLSRSWDSYFVLRKSKGIVNPRPPRYKDDIVEFSYVQNGIKHNGDIIRLSLSKNMKSYLQSAYGIEIKYLWLKSDCFKQFQNIKQIRFLKQKNDYRMCIIHEIPDVEPLCDNGNYLSLDIGIHNFLTAYDSANNESFIIGRELISVERYFDKKISHYQSIYDLQQKEVKFKKKSKRVLKLYDKKYNKVKDYLHKVTTALISYCVDNNINTVIIGNITNIRKDKNLGHANNQKFHSLPFAKLIQMLEYKCKLAGITLLRQSEAYSSQCGPKSLEVSSKYANKTNRKERGLYIDDGVIYNADSNGAYNIYRLACQEGKAIFKEGDISALSHPCVFKVAV